MNRSVIWNPLFGKPRYEYRARINPAHPLNQGLVGWWLFNNGAGQCSNLMSGVQTSLSGSTLWSKEGLYFDGAGDYVDFGDLFYSDALSLVIHCHPTTVDANGRTIILKRNGAGTVTASTSEWWFIHSNASLGLYAWNSSNTVILSFTTAAPLVAGAWSHVVAVAGGNGNYSYISVNGVVDGSGSQTGVIRNSTSAIQIAARSTNDNNRYFIGDIGYVLIYNVALTTSQASELYVRPYGTPDNPRLIVEPRRTWFIASNLGYRTSGPFPISHYGVVRG